MKLTDLWKEVQPLIERAGTVPFPLEGNVAAVFRIGSHSHGTHIPPEDADGIDDTDLMVVVIPPVKYVLGLQRFEHATFKVDQWDVVIYDWGKWLRLIMKQNPNVVGTLWLEPEDMLVDDHCGPMRDVLLSREKFLSREMYPAFVGYAKAQLYKMTHTASQGYMGAKRKALVEQHGYDTKNAAHMLRLLNQAIDALKYGKMKVRCNENYAAFLKTVKRGMFTQDAIVRLAEDLFAKADEAVIQSFLPEHPDRDLVEQAMVDGYILHWPEQEPW